MLCHYIFFFGGVCGFEISHATSYFCDTFRTMNPFLLTLIHLRRFVKKYRRYEKRHSNIPVHCSPAFRVKEGDIVTIGECRPLSKTVRFNVIKHESVSSRGAKNVRKQFRMF